MGLRYSWSLWYTLSGVCLIATMLLFWMWQDSPFRFADGFGSDTSIHVGTLRVSPPITDLLEAARADDTKACKALVERDANVNEEGEFGDTPLSWAVDNQNLELVRLLLERGANPNAHVQWQTYHFRDAVDETPLIGAMRRSNLPIFYALLNSKRINVDSSVEEGRTPLIDSLDTYGDHRTINITFVRALLDRGADPNLKDRWETPLEWACWSSYDAARLLLDHGAKLNVGSLFVAAHAGHVDILGLLLAHGGDINAR